VAHGFQSALSGSRFYQAPGFAGGQVTEFFSEEAPFSQCTKSVDNILTF